MPFDEDEFETLTLYAVIGWHELGADQLNLIPQFSSRAVTYISLGVDFV
jgi:hypothetical protein